MVNREIINLITEINKCCMCVFLICFANTERIFEAYSTSKNEQ